MPKQEASLISVGPDMSGKRLLIYLTALLLLLCSVGCELVDVDGNPMTRPTRGETMKWDGLELDPELRQVLDEKSSCLLWRIPAEFRTEGAASVRSYESLNCSELWMELRESVFPDASLTTEAQTDGALEMYYSDGDSGFSVQLNTFSVFLDGLPLDRTTVILQQITAFLEYQTGFALAQWTGCAPEAQHLTYGFEIDGIPVDVKMDSPMQVSCVFAQTNGRLILWNPILPGEPLKRFVLEDCLNVMELRSTAETSWEKGFNMAAEMKACCLIYYLDGNEMTLRPGWSLTGTGYDYVTGEMKPIEIVIDAVTGEVKRKR
ncbi:MAG: hypothetical protein II885_18225 [Oscillospiraceae bacterium]|nr:hypothetical protein [Oscillospiraceae bacterium]